MVFAAILAVTFAAMSWHVNYWRFKSPQNRQYFTCRKIVLEITAKVASVNGPLGTFISTKFVSRQNK